MKPAKVFLFAADLDGTLLPNTGRQAAEGCLQRTRTMLDSLLSSDCPVCYISGRHLGLAREVLLDFGLPRPSYWVCNVGSEIYDGEGTLDGRWEDMLGEPFDHANMWQALRDIDELSLQEEEKQGLHKFSLYSRQPASSGLLRRIRERLRPLSPNIRLVDSVEESTGRGLLDVLPLNSGKSSALHYLAEKHHLPFEAVFFAGDSGNDMDALLSGVRGTLVGNAPSQVRSELERRRRHQAGKSHVYLAVACYGDGVIEGLKAFGFVVDNGD